MPLGLPDPLRAVASSPPATPDIDHEHIRDIMNISISALQPHVGLSCVTSVDGGSDLDLVIQGGPAHQHVSGSYTIQDITHPVVVANRIASWPLPVYQDCARVDCLHIYNSVRATGLPNMLAAKKPIMTQLRPSAWIENAVGHCDDDFIIRGIQYGFPLQYVGGPINVQNPDVHLSAKNDSHHIQAYLDTEIANLAIIGPFHSPPFHDWFHTSPLMTRPKSDPTKRRVIVDLSFPSHQNVNLAVPKNVLFGNIHEHNLPTIDQLVEAVKDRHFRCALATIDIQRAYRNIPVCPLDYPLLGIKFNNKFYVDTALPFGARNSSLVMQKIPSFITRALAARGIFSYMFLDDLVLVLDADHDPDLEFATALELFRQLGLPIAYDKLQPPSKVITYLGIKIDLTIRELSIPARKIDEFLALIHSVTNCDSISMKEFQSIIGKINFFSKVVKPARLFMARALATYRQNYDQKFVPVNDAIKADLRWFKKFLVPYNGRTMIDTSTPTKTIVADSCLTGGGATDFTTYYTLVYPPRVRDAFHITILEALNCLVALRRFLSDSDNGSTVRLCCDNLSTVFCLTTGKARDPVLAAIARAAWYIQAKRNIDLIVDHIPGSDMQIADALSRAHLSPHHKDTAQTYIDFHHLTKVHAPTFMLDYKPYL